MRGFEIAKGFEDKVKELPKRGTKHSAGYDLSIVEDLIIAPKTLGVGVTGVKAYMGEDEVLQIFPRSSLPRKYGLILPNSVGIIDSDYYSNPTNDGVIHVQLYNLSEKEVFIPAGERIAQGIFMKFLKQTDEEIPTRERNGGFGSTDK